MPKMTKLNSFVELLVLVSCFWQASVQAADPCFDLESPNPGGLTGNCIPGNSCDGDQSQLPDLCPSFPSDHVCCFSESFPGRELRGAWIATVTNIDWPNSPNDAVQAQQTNLMGLIDRLYAAGMNAVYFQVRPCGDALFQSPLEPWSIYLTGEQGKAPSPLWDPLQFVIDFARTRNIEVHAWLNPYRAKMSPTRDGLAANHMAVRFPQYAYNYSSYLWMDPGAAEVQNRTVAVVLDLVTRYNLAGIHMDDYFYPYPVSGLTFPDEATYAAREDQSLSLADWRRDNVNKLIRRLNEEIHQIKPWVVFSISPFGIYRPCEDEGMPCSIQGLDQYSQLYSDPKLWLQQGWIDVLQPQLYWRIDPPLQSYPVLLKWWTDINTQNRHVYAGNYLTRIDLQNWPLSEIANQIRISREYRSTGSWGNVQFSAKTLNQNFNGSVEYFQRNIYQFPALPPAFPWLAERASKNLATADFITAPAVVKLRHDGALTSLRITYPRESFKLVVYVAGNQDKWQIYRVHSSSLPHELDLQDGQYAFSVLDRYGRESRKQYVNVP